ncbi:MAG TPA: adenosylcobinamide-GDP ribazoletransferase, partial [Polyangiales bacterium]|nr:adenosylcobinamide-GDP ribazoletransferase [Polyangiales bacterium]
IAIGAVAAAVFWAASIVFPPVIAAILSTIATVALTGALHEDGLADTMDGLGGGHTRERALQIMKDPRIGSFGALSLMLVVSLKIATISALPLTWLIMALISGHALSRWCAVLLVLRLPYARADSSTRARPVIERVARTDLIVATVFGLAPLGACVAFASIGVLGTHAPDSVAAQPGALADSAQAATAVLASLSVTALPGALAAVVTTGLLGLWYARRLGGYTGDTLGATQQITEVVFYLAMLAAWNSR